MPGASDGAGFISAGQPESVEIHLPQEKTMKDYTLVCEECGFYIHFPDGRSLQSALDVAWAAHEDASPLCSASEPFENIDGQTWRVARRDVLAKHARN